MTERALEMIPEYVLGTLSEAEMAELDDLIAGSPELQAEVAAVSDAYAALGDALPAENPSAHVKTKLMASIQTEHRFAPFTKTLSKWFDLGAERITEVLKMIDDATAWKDGPMPGIRIIDFDGGPNALAPDTGWVRMPAGIHFPWHRHDGPEITIILEGTIRDHDGTVYGPGEVIEYQAGSEHEYWIGEDQELLFGIIHLGFQIIPKPGAGE